jgi:hypothetical protein
MLEADGCEVLTKREYVVQTPAGENIMSKQDTGVCRGLPYINLCYHMGGFALIETIEDNIDTFLDNGDSDEKITKAMLFRIVQKQIGYSPDGEFKQI